MMFDDFIMKYMRRESQLRFLEYGLDVNDAFILAYFTEKAFNREFDFFDEEDGKRFYYVDYATLLDDLPTLHMQKHALYLHFRKMVKAGVLTHETVRKDGTFSCYGFGKNYSKLIGGDE